MSSTTTKCNSTNSSPMNKLLDGKRGRRVAGQLRNRPKKIDKKSADLEKKHMNFINYTLSEFRYVSHKNIINLLKINKENYQDTWDYLLSRTDKKNKVFFIPSQRNVYSKKPFKKRQVKMICKRQGNGERSKDQYKRNTARSNMER
tara:strand:- start:244 stop:681 length:438 start_codon:yes stop_codon:yes gene_type:complete